MYRAGPTGPLKYYVSSNDVIMKPVTFTIKYVYGIMVSCTGLVDEKMKFSECFS